MHSCITQTTRGYVKSMPRSFLWTECTENIIRKHAPGRNHFEHLALATNSYSFGQVRGLISIRVTISCIFLSSPKFLGACCLETLSQPSSHLYALKFTAKPLIQRETSHAKFFPQFEGCSSESESAYQVRPSDRKSESESEKRRDCFL